MEIAIYSPSLGTIKSGGTETFLREVIKRLQDRHEITVITGAGNLTNEVGELKANIITIPFISREKLGKLGVSGAKVFDIESLTMYRKARSVLKDNSFDIISTHYYLDNLLLSKTKLSTPIVFRFPGIKNLSLRWKLMKKYSNSVYLANSQSTAKRVQRLLGVKLRGVVYPGVDTHYFKPKSRNSGEEFEVLYVGRIDSGKGLNSLLTATRILRRDKGINAKTVLVGDGSQKNQLIRKSEKLGIKNNIFFYGGVPHKDLPEIYNSCDVFCLPSEHEGFPVVNLEAMACQKPVVTTDLDSTREQIDHGRDGLLVEPQNPVAIADEIEKLYFDDNLREKIGEKARKKVLRCFTWEKQVRMMEGYYEEFC